MPVCKRCGDEADELTTAVEAGRRRRVCEECAELIAEDDAIAEASEAAMRSMMEYKGR